MLEHLLGATPIIEDFEEGSPKLRSTTKVRPDEIARAQVETAAWLESLGAPDDDDITAQQQQEAAREAFALLTNPSPDEKQHTALLRLKSPAAVQRLHVMLTEYDWEFVNQAKEIRNYVVGKIMTETTHHDARIRLKALELLGKVTEVSAFTDRVEIKHTQVDEEELKARLREKFERYLKTTGALEDTELKEELPVDDLTKQGDSIAVDAQT